MVGLKQGKSLAFHAKLSLHYPEMVGTKSLIVVFIYTNQIQIIKLYSFHPLTYYGNFIYQVH